jgi:hypothetical protein
MRPPNQYMPPPPKSRRPGKQGFDPWASTRGAGRI